jgi:hypothetical protein
MHEAVLQYMQTSMQLKRRTTFCAVPDNFKISTLPTSVLEAQMREAQQNAQALLHNCCAAELMSYIVYWLEGAEQDCVSGARNKNNDWRTTARRLGEADGLKTAVACAAVLESLLQP